jgi:hypothetical protein
LGIALEIANQGRRRAELRANTDRAASERAPVRFALSILIPVYNGAGRIRRLVRALEELAIEEDGHEIQLVDDGSRDNSPGQVTFNPQSEGLGRAPLGRNNRA